jgi:hypothetical protein
MLDERHPFAKGNAMVGKQGKLHNAGWEFTFWDAAL